MNLTSTAEAPRGQICRGGCRRLPADVDWEMLDKSRFFLLGAALFSGLSTALYPFFVLKTRQQVCPHPSGPGSSLKLGMDIVRREGTTALYRGLGTSLLGTIPARALYTCALEVTKSGVGTAAAATGLPETAVTTVANAAAGLSASIAAQVVWTPVDVISQRLMVRQGKWHAGAAPSGLSVLRTILRTEGIRGLYRGFGISVLTYAPSSALWWASYCLSQRLIWKNLTSGGVGGGYYYYYYYCVNPPHSSGLVVGVQALSAACAGGVAALATMPLDTIKTRLQVLEKSGGTTGRPTCKQTIEALLQESGWKACFRGLGPRWMSMSLSATAMVTTYEFLKRTSTKHEYQQQNTTA